LAFLIRSAVPDDLGVLLDIYVRSSLSDEDDREALLAHPDALVLGDAGVREGRTRVATTPEGRIVGFATWLRTRGALDVEDLVVDPEWMGRGVGRELVLDLPAVAHQQRVGRLEVTANRRASGFYKKMGFVEAGETATRFGPALRMRLDLGPP
jgi:ribosomal protein S18 acetylase RimI-like enzyme